MAALRVAALFLLMIGGLVLLSFARELSARDTWIVAGAFSVGVLTALIGPSFYRWLNSPEERPLIE